MAAKCLDTSIMIVETRVLSDSVLHPPLPHNATWGNTQVLTTKNKLLPEFSYKGSCISTVFCVDIQHVLPCCHDPLGRYGDETEDKSLYATRFLEPESLGVKLANDGLIEIVYQCRKQKKDRVLCHERLWEPVQAERFFKRAQRTNLFGLCRAQETKVALPRYQRLSWG